MNQKPISVKVIALAEQKIKDFQVVKQLSEYYMRKPTGTWTDEGFILWVKETIKEIRKAENVSRKTGSARPLRKI